jgi:hypothetical protein
MRINYFKISSSGLILESYVDSSDKNYISHTEDSVTFTNHSYDQNWKNQYEHVTRTRVFDVIRQERVETYKNRIKDLQESLVALENANSYNHYTELIYKNK